MTKEEFQDALIEYLKDKPLNTIHLARECEVAVSTVNRWVRGASCPGPRAREWIISWTT
jgi:hypothetical protein